MHEMMNQTKKLMKSKKKIWCFTWNLWWTTLADAREDASITKEQAMSNIWQRSCMLYGSKNQASFFFKYGEMIIFLPRKYLDPRDLIECKIRVGCINIYIDKQEPFPSLRKEIDYAA